MTISTIAYARDNMGKLAVFKINEVPSYKDAIEAVKHDLGVKRALCLVMPQVRAEFQPITDQEAA